MGKIESALLLGTCEFSQTYLRSLLPHSLFEEMHVVTPPGLAFPLSLLAQRENIPVHRIPATGLKNWSVWVALPICLCIGPTAIGRPEF